MYAFDNRPSRYPKAAPIMSQLALLLPDNPGAPEFEPLPALLEADMSAAGDFIRDAAAASTRRAYRSDWRLFTGWCTARGAEPLRPRPPSSPRSWPQRPIEAPSPRPSRAEPLPSDMRTASPATSRPRAPRPFARR